MDDHLTLHVDPIGHRIIAFMRQQPEGMTNPGELVAHLNVPEEDVRAELAKLERLGVVDRGHTSEGNEEYMLNPTRLGS